MTTAVTHKNLLITIHLAYSVLKVFLGFAEDMLFMLYPEIKL
jgi:hypothetical protein